MVLSSWVIMQALVILLSLFSTCLLASSDLDYSRADIRELNALSGKLLRVAEVRSSKSKSMIMGLDRFMMKIEESSKINPNQGKWRGQFDYALANRRSLDGKWIAFQAEWSLYSDLQEFKNFSKSVEQYLSYRRKSQYEQAENYLSSSYFINKIRLLKEKVNSPSLLLESEDLLELRTIINKFNGKTPASIEQRINMSLSEPATTEKLIWKPKQATEENLADYTWGLFGLLAGLATHLARSKSTKRTAMRVYETGAIVKVDLLGLKLDSLNLLTSSTLTSDIVEAFAELSDDEQKDNVQNGVLSQIDDILRSVSDLDTSCERDIFINNIKELFKDVQGRVQALKQEESTPIIEAQIKAYRKILYALVEMGDLSKSKVRLPNEKVS